MVPLALTHGHVPKWHQKANGTKDYSLEPHHNTTIRPPDKRETPVAPKSEAPELHGGLCLGQLTTVDGCEIQNSLWVVNSLWLRLKFRKWHQRSETLKWIWTFAESTIPEEHVIRSSYWGWEPKSISHLRKPWCLMRFNVNTNNEIPWSQMDDDSLVSDLNPLTP